jgi:hypothetical protein
MQRPCVSFRVQRNQAANYLRVDVVWFD